MDINEKIKLRRIEIGKTLEEIGKVCAVSKGTVLRWESGEIQNLKIDKIVQLAKALEVPISYLLQEGDNDLEFLCKIPLFQPVSCGIGSFVEENIQEMITLPQSMLKKDCEYFANIAEGDSMINENIRSGDLLIFEKTEVLRNGQIGCFCLEDNEALCKIFQYDEKNGIILLLPANTHYTPITVTAEDTGFRIIGKLAFVISDRQQA